MPMWGALDFSDWSNAWLLSLVNSPWCLNGPYRQNAPPTGRPAPMPQNICSTSVHDMMWAVLAENAHLNACEGHGVVLTSNSRMGSMLGNAACSSRAIARCAALGWSVGCHCRWDMAAAKCTAC